MGSQRLKVTYSTTRGFGVQGLQLRVQILGFQVKGSRQNRRLTAPLPFRGSMWEFPKIRDILFWGPYKKDPTI